MGFFDFLKFWKKKQDNEVVKNDSDSDDKESKPIVDPVVPPQAEPSPEVAPVVPPRPKPIVDENPERKDVHEPKEETESRPKPKADPVTEEDDDEPVYEVRTHDDGGWQVIKKGAERATRRLETQAKAIEYCEEHDFSYEVYKMDGTLK
ncbi:MAG: DUF2188 domain-containing protein [Candidatus Izemoplasma sp.]|nr:DUF2188 domain-containing protein [Candidatus Izemoplasma sp.]